MLSRLTSIVIVLAATAASASGPGTVRDPQNLVVHEWGTFTSIAGENGEAIMWWVLDVEQDLPCFVNSFRGFPKGSAQGTVRMETPVLYFYAAQPTTVDVAVRFRRGMITEWFPHAVVTPTTTRAAGFAATGFTSTIAWDNVRISPGAGGEFPIDRESSHYYAARATDAAPIAVGSQKEKFLFYRGIAGFGVPISATVDINGIRVKSNTRGPVTGLILFENRDGRIAYRMLPALDRELSVQPPADGGSLASLGLELEKLLVSEGLYPKEAKAMVETWRDSWFQEGTRLFYIVPPAMIDDVLPLSITPRPTHIDRVFVGRLELITPAIMEDVRGAVARLDAKGGAKYGRLLPSILDRIYPFAAAPTADRVRANQLRDQVYQQFARRTCPAPSVGTAPGLLR